MYLEIISTITIAGFVYVMVSYMFHLSMLKAKEIAKAFPPGPIPLPVIGNLHLLGKHPHKALKELSNKYGEVFGISLGSKRVVLINTIEPAREALIQKGADFAGRPTDMYTAEIISRGYEDILLSDYGPMWKTLRKVAHSSLKMYGTGMGRLEKLVLKETEELIKRLDAKIGQPFNPKDDIGKWIYICCLHAFYPVRGFRKGSGQILKHGVILLTTVEKHENSLVAKLKKIALFEESDVLTVHTATLFIIC